MSYGFHPLPAFPGMALLLGLAPLLHSAPLIATEPSMTAIADFGEYRIDGLRAGVFEGQTVRIVDMTLVNRSTTTTFPETIVEVWWQGSNSGAESIARHRDLSPRGRFEYIKPGQTWQASYVIPFRDDVKGVRLQFPKGRGMAEQTLAWTEITPR